MRNKKPEIKDLDDSSRFRLIDTIPHDDLLPFLTRQFEEKGIVIKLYLGLLAAMFLLLLLWSIYQFTNTSWTVWAYTKWVLLAVAFSCTLLIPIHEGIHALFYKLAGAPKVSFGGSLKKMYFYAAADLFILSGKPFIVLAIAPFIAITLAGMIIACFVAPLHQLFVYWVVFIHATMCSGDFIMISYFFNKNMIKLYTFDDVSNKMSYFYEKL